MNLFTLKYTPLNRIKGMAGTVGLLLVLLCGQSCPAQSSKRLPDSIPGSVENTPPPVVDTAVALTDSLATITASDTAATGGHDTETVRSQPDSATFRTVPDSVITRLKKDKDFAYANDPAYWTTGKKEDRRENGFFHFLETLFRSRGFMYFFYTLLGAILLYALYRIIAENNLRFFYKAGAKAIDTDKQAVSMKEEDLEAGLNKAMLESDHRMAVRYLYLKALRLLDAKEWIRYHAQATNQEYISQLGGLPQQETFRFLTRAYERVWYGDFAISGEQFTSLLNYFQDFYKSIASPPASTGSLHSSFIGSAVLLLLLLPFFSCNSGGTKKLNRKVTVWRKDKLPYGTSVAYDNLPYLFPDAAITLNQLSPSDVKSPVNMNNSSDIGTGKKAYIIIASHVYAEPAEISSIMNFVGQGNHVFISAFQFSDSLLHLLKCKPAPRLYAEAEPDSMRLSIYNPVSFDSLPFAYPGAAYDNWVMSVDSQYTTILGRDANGRPNLLKFNYKGGGTLFLQFAPTAFTNFFLLHKQNNAYYNNALSYLPVSVKEVIWDEYFRYERKNSNFSALQYIFSNRSLRWAFWLLLLLFALIYLFESKRKQRTVPVVEPLRNNSLDFVKTIGRLYYQRHDNHNLALKMSAHFLDHVRTRFNLPVTNPDEGFIERLSYKTGYPKADLQDLVTDIQRLHLEPWMTDADLLAFHRKIDTFYKHV